jgi:hypothetical protein
MSLELEIEAIKEGNNANKGVANPGIFLGRSVKRNNGSTSKLSRSYNMYFVVERIEESIPVIQVNTNKEQTEEEVVVIGAMTHSQAP